MATPLLVVFVGVGEGAFVGTTTVGVGGGCVGITAVAVGGACVGRTAVGASVKGGAVGAGGSDVGTFAVGSTGVDVGAGARHAALKQTTPRIPQRNNVRGENRAFIVSSFCRFCDNAEENLRAAMCRRDMRFTLRTHAKVKPQDIAVRLDKVCAGIVRVARDHARAIGVTFAQSFDRPTGG